MKSLIEKRMPLYEGRRITREEYLDLPDDGYKYDMIQGVLHMSPSPFFEHCYAVSQFIYLLTGYLKKKPVGFAVSEIDILLPDGGDILRPDISFLFKEHKDIIIGHIHGVPDLICEVLSQKTATRDFGEKAERYLKNGVKEYYILDPRDKSMQIWLNRKTKWEKIICQKGDMLKSQILQGFHISAEEIFSEIDE